MGLGRDDLVLSAGTHLVTPFLERLAPAAAAGFSGVSVYPHEIDQLRAGGMADAEIRARVADAGLAVGELDAVTSWLPGSRPPTGTDAALAAMLAGNTAERLCPMAEAVGARSVTVVEFYGDHPTADAAAEAFATVCDLAAEHGVLAHLEFLPWAGIPDLAQAYDVVRLAGRSNGGLLVDSWHFARSGSSLDELRQIPGARILYVQISDAPVTPGSDLADETQHRRLVPGEGALDLVSFVQAVDATGTDAPVGAEVFSDELSAQPLAAVADRVASATRDVLSRARAAPAGGSSS